MSSIGYTLDMGELLIAMKKALQTQTVMPYLRDVRIAHKALWWWEPWSPYTVYLRPGGSPETDVAVDGSPGVMKYATHEVYVEAVKLIDNPYDEDALVGVTNESTGITKFGAALLDFLEGNMLGLSGELVGGVPPVCEIPSDGYAVIEAADDVWLTACRIIYRAQTSYFVRVQP